MKIAETFEIKRKSSQKKFPSHSQKNFIMESALFVSLLFELLSLQTEQKLEIIFFHSTLLYTIIPRVIQFSASVSNVLTSTTFHFVLALNSFLAYFIQTTSCKEILFHSVLFFYVYFYLNHQMTCFFYNYSSPICIPILVLA